MIYTSSFFKFRGLTGVSVARRAPSFFQGPSIRELAPPKRLIKQHGLSDAEWTDQYTRKILDRLNPYLISQQLEGCTLLCWERPGDFCHRHLVADWITRETGIIVREFDAKESIILKTNPSVLVSPKY